MKNTKIIIKNKSKSYPIFFGKKILNTIGKKIEKKLPNVKKISIICDKNLPKIFQKKLNKSLKKYDLKIYKIKANEKTKSFRVAQKIIEDILQNNFNRSDCIIAFGGGIIGDLSAFVANLAKRGMKFINIPTTLLAQSEFCYVHRFRSLFCRIMRANGNQCPSFLVIFKTHYFNVKSRNIIILSCLR